MESNVVSAVPCLTPAVKGQQGQMSVKDSLFINSQYPLFPSVHFSPKAGAIQVWNSTETPKLSSLTSPGQYNTAGWHYQIYICIYIYICTCAEKRSQCSLFQGVFPKYLYCTTFRIYIDRTRHRKCGMKPRPCFWSRVLSPFPTPSASS